jgi:phosphoglycolate phosphatase-like HAD superfamily hydrolase
MTAAYRPRLLVDFDGVIHRYGKGWHDGTAYDEPMPGARKALEQLNFHGYEIVIFSTRDAEQIQEWLTRYNFQSYRVTNVKEPALAIIDDRAIQFTSWERTLEVVKQSYDI